MEYLRQLHAQHRRPGRQKDLRPVQVVPDWHEGRAVGAHFSLRIQPQWLDFKAGKGEEVIKRVARSLRPEFLPAL